MALPTWLENHLTNIGALNPDGIARGARINHCAQCRHRTLTGLDADRAALVAICDPTEIDTNGELLALALGLRTYTLTRATTGSGKATWNLDPRDQWRIEAGPPTTAMVAQHRCGIAIPAATTSAIPATSQPRPAPELPDF